MPSGLLPSSGTCHAPESARKSAEGREHLRVRWEPAGRLLGVREPAIHGNLEHTTAGPVQLHLRAGCRLLNQTCRRTGARFIASHSAIFNLNLHDLLSRFHHAYRNNNSHRALLTLRSSYRLNNSLHHDAQVFTMYIQTDITVKTQLRLIGPLPNALASMSRRAFSWR